jgi:toxin secretion/phage lysis holin
MMETPLLVLLRNVAFGNWTLVLLLSLISIDIVTGVVAAWGNGTISSEVSKKGISEKVLMLLGVAFAFVMGSLVGVPLGPPCAVYYCYHESVSITENLAQAGLPLPDFVSNVLVRVKKASDLAPPAPLPRAPGGRAR